MHNTTDSELHSQKTRYKNRTINMVTTKKSLVKHRLVGDRERKTPLCSKRPGVVFNKIKLAPKITKMLHETADL